MDLEYALEVLSNKLLGHDEGIMFGLGMSFHECKALPGKLSPASYCIRKV